ncbi:hypothetical protein EYV94_20780 [Puteibacter caeruleilacunae]|nr:hypothetical protein EYV94_20780 [Puteibacter caeruleilacunae]
MDNKKLYDLNQIRFACILGSPFVAGILISHNYSKFGERRKSILWIVICTLWTLSIVGISMLIPENITSTGLVIPLINGWIIHELVKNRQGERLNEHFENNGEKGSNWLPLGLTALVVALIFGPVIFLDKYLNENNYLRADFKGNGVFYNLETPIDQVDKLAGILTRMGYFNPDKLSEVVFVDCDSVFELKLVSDKDYFNDTEYLNDMQSVFKHISYYDFSKPVKFNLIDEYLKTEKRIVLSQSDSIQYYMESVLFVKNKNFKLCYDIMIPEDERLKFQDLILGLKRFFPHHFKGVFIYGIVDNSYMLSIYVPKANWKKPQLLTEVKLLKRKLNEANFSKPFRLNLYDPTGTDQEELEVQ